MRSLSFAFCATALVAISACSGGGSSSNILPPGASAASRTTAGSSVAFGNAQVFVAASDAMRAFPATTNGAYSASNVAATYPYPAGQTPVDVVEAPDATVYILTTTAPSGTLSAPGPSYVTAFAPKTRAVEEQFTLPAGTTPLAIALVGDGIDISTSDATYTYAYGAGNNPSPIRTLNVGGRVVVDRYDRLYFPFAYFDPAMSQVAVYAAGASGNAQPVRTINAVPASAAGAPSAYLKQIIVGRDLTIYGNFDESPTDSGTSVIQTIPANGTTPRLVAMYDAVHGTAGAQMARALAVDTHGYLYVGAGLNNDDAYLGVQPTAVLDVYAPGATMTNGQDAPVRHAVVAPAAQGLVSIATGV